MPGDVVEVTKSDDCLIKAGESYGVIEGEAGVRQEEYEVTFNPSPLPWWDNNIVNSSGGPSRVVKALKLEPTKKMKKQQFHYFPHGPAAHSAEIAEHIVKVWAIDLTQF
jgi:hypothetical protein